MSNLVQMMFMVCSIKIPHSVAMDNACFWWMEI